MVGVGACLGKDNTVTTDAVRQGGSGAEAQEQLKNGDATLDKAHVEMALGAGALHINNDMT